jgi:predicted HicB family RNase H-like nuclease
MGYLRYEGYMGSVEYNENDGCLHGQVQGMRDELLCYKGKSVAELEKKFKSSIDKYLANCQKKGIDPKRPYNGPLNVRLGPELHFRAAMMAEKMDRTINSLIKEAVTKLLAQYDDY